MRPRGWGCVALPTRAIYPLETPLGPELGGRWQGSVSLVGSVTQRPHVKWGYPLCSRLNVKAETVS